MSREIAAFRGTGYDPEEMGPLDLVKLGTITNESTGVAALRLVSDPAFIHQLGVHHTEHEIADLRRAVFRGCIAHGVALPSTCIVQARMLGVVVP